MRLFVDTSVWSLAFRRDSPPISGATQVLTQTLEEGGLILTTGLVLQEVLQGISGPRVRARLLDYFSVLPMLVPDRDDHIAAADLRNRCRRAGVQVGTVDTLLAQLCIQNDLTMLSIDKDFDRIASLSALKIWRGVG